MFQPLTEGEVEAKCLGANGVDSGAMDEDHCEDWIQLPLVDELVSS